MGSGQNGSIKKRVVLVRVKMGSGRNWFGSERVLGQNGFRVGLGQVFFFKHKIRYTK
ncbi:hypothetical protein Hanom_Chr11g01002591 [Helianthus anomalus]